MDSNGCQEEGGESEGANDPELRAAAGGFGFHQISCGLDIGNRLGGVNAGNDAADGRNERGRRQRGGDDEVLRDEPNEGVVGHLSVSEVHLRLTLAFQATEADVAGHSDDGEFEVAELNAEVAADGVLSGPRACWQRTR